MDHGVAIIVCEACGAVSASTERGWRAYLDEGTIGILCPCCAEVFVGEDEAALSD
jgi:hypothetical protein